MSLGHVVGDLGGRVLGSLKLQSYYFLGLVGSLVGHLF
jgi:hypothetical protein